MASQLCGRLVATFAAPRVAFHWASRLAKWLDPIAVNMHQVSMVQGNERFEGVQTYRGEYHRVVSFHPL